MTDEEIIKFGAEAGLCDYNGEDDNCYNVLPQMRKFASFIAAAEREACAKLCYELPWKDMGHTPSNLTFAAAIRARGEK